MKSEPKRVELGKLAASYRRALRVNPEYQRGTVWSVAQKQALIDSLLRGYHIPLFYIHLLEKDNEYTGTKETTAWLVDGQQRLAAIADYLNNQFPLPNAAAEGPGGPVPSALPAGAPWAGKRFDELAPEHQASLLAQPLSIIEMREDAPNEARDLFIRLQAGTPLTAQQKRDAWPGDFTTFVIRHAGKEEHPDSRPKPFFALVSRGKAKKINVDAGDDDYVDGRADTRKFFAGLAMTIMRRQRSGVDFVDLKGKSINELYRENLTLPPEDVAAVRVVRVLDAVAALPGFHDLLVTKPVTYQMGFHFALLVDSLTAGDYVPSWRDRVVKAFREFQDDVATARQAHRTTRQTLPHYTRFIAQLGGSGSDTAEVIRTRHAFFLQEIHPKLALVPLDPKRLFDGLEKEVIWIRDDRRCQNPDHKAAVTFPEARIHHINEHSAGGVTALENGILVCQKCHSDRQRMQSLAPVFQQHIRDAKKAATTERGAG